MNTVISGAVAGFTATVPMTAAMEAMHALLPEHEQYPLPPRLITENVLEKAEVEDEVPEPAEENLALANHFAYGTATGAIYGAGLGLLGVKANAANGIIYGLGVWAASYQGLLPAVGLLRPAHEHPARRNALMIAAHIVWGAALGITHRKLNEDKP